MKTIFQLACTGDASHRPVSRKPFPHTGYLLLLLLLCAASSAFAAKRYWIATGAGTNNWNTTAHWSTASGGGSGASVPGSSDTAYFDSNGLGRCSIDATVNVKRFEVTSTFTDTIDQNSYTITVGTGGMVLDAGVFNGGSANIQVNGNYSNSACVFTSTSSQFIPNGDFSLTGTGRFIHNNGTTNFNLLTGWNSTSITISTSSADSTFYKVKFTNTYTRVHTISSGSVLTVLDTLFFSNSHNCSFTGNIEAKGNICVNSTFGLAVNSGATALLKINGSGTQYMISQDATVCSKLLPLEIVKSAADTLKLSGDIFTPYNWKLTSGIMHAGTSTVATIPITGTSTQTFTGLFTGANAFYRFGSAGSGAGTINLTISDTIEVKDSLRFLHSSSLASVVLVKGTNAGIIMAKKHIRYNAVNLSSSNGKVLINGSGTQVIKSNLTALPGRPMPYTVITKVSTDTLKLIGHLKTSENWTYNSGVINSDNALVNFINLNNTITGSHSLKKVAFTFSTAYPYALTIASGTELTVLDSLLYTGSESSYVNTGVVNLKGNLGLGNTGTTNGGSATIKINGTADQHIWGFTGSGNKARLCHVTIDKSSGTLYLHDKICFGTTSSGNATTVTYTAGTIDAGTSTVVFANSKTVTINHASNKLSLYNVIFDGPTYATSINLSSGDTLVANGTMTVSGDLNVNLNTAYFHAKGDITVTNTNTSCNGSGFLWINGTGSQLFTGSGTTGAGTLPNIVINKASGTLSLASTISCNGDWTYTQGTVSPGTSNVAFIGTKNLDGQGTSSTMSFYKIATFSSGTRTLTGNLDVNDKLLISASTTLSAGTYTINVGGQWSNNGTWTAGTSTVVLDGSGYTKVSKSGGSVETFNNLTMNRSFTSSSTTLECPVKVNGTLTMTKGKIKTTRVTAYVELADNALVVGGHDSAYVHGVVRKTGNDTVWFPLGDTTLTSGAYHPLRISAPSSATDQFEAEYLAKNPQTIYGTTKVDSLEAVSNCEHWLLERTVGSSSPQVRLGWNKNLCGIDSYNDLRVTAWNGTQWNDHGASNITVNNLRGFVTATSAIGYTANPAPITLSKKKAFTQYALLHRKLDGGFYQARNGKLAFRFDEEYLDTDGDLDFTIYDEYTVPVVTSTWLATNNPTALPAAIYGDNRYVLNLLTCVMSQYGALTNGVYVLEVTNEKNEKWYLRFTNTNTISVSCSGSPWGQ